MSAFLGYGDIGLWAMNRERDAFLACFAKHRCSPGTRWEHCMNGSSGGWATAVSMQFSRFGLLLIWFLVAFITLIVALRLWRGGGLHDQSPAVIFMSFFIFRIVIYGEAIRDCDARFNIVFFVLPPTVVSAPYLKIIKKRLK